MNKFLKRTVMVMMSIMFILAMPISSMTVFADIEESGGTDAAEIDGLHMSLSTLKDVPLISESGDTQAPSKPDYDNEANWGPTNADITYLSLTEDTETPALVLFIQALNGVKVKSGNSMLPLSMPGLFGSTNYTNNIEGNIQYIKDKVGYGDGSTFIPIYALKALTNTDNVGLNEVYACDYNKADNKFYYYHYIAYAKSSYDDDFDINCYTSTALIYPELTTYTFVNTNELNFANYPADFTADITSNLLHLISVLSVNAEGNNVAGACVKAGTVAGENKKQLQMIDSLLGWTGVAAGNEAVAGQYQASLRLSYKDVHFAEPYYSNDGGIVSLEYAYNNNNENTAWPKIVNLETTEEGRHTLATYDIHLTEGYVNFGDTGELSGSDDDYADARPIYDFVASILDGVATVEGANTLHSADDYVALFRNANCNTVADILESFKEELQRHIERQSLPLVTSDVFKDVSDPYDIVSAVLQYAVSNKNDIEWNSCYTIADGTQLKVSYQFSQIDNDDIGGITVRSTGYYWSQLNNYQKAVLSTAYSEKRNAATNKPPIIYFGTVDKTYNPASAANIINMQGMPTIEEVQKAVEEYDQSSLSVTGNVLNIARVAGILGKYSVYSAVYTNSEDVSSLYALYNDRLESLITAVWNYPDMSDTQFSVLPKKIGIFGTDSAEYVGLCETDENWQRFVSMLYNVDYAFEVCAWSEEGEVENYTPDLIKSWFNGTAEDDSYPSALEFLSSTEDLSNYDIASLGRLNLGDQSKNMLRSIIELHDLCEFLQISGSDWSPTIKAYLDVYNENKTFFELLRSSGIIYSLAESGTASIEEPLGMFFNLEDQTMTDQWIKGFALSALYVPMETNVYDANTVLYVNDPEWVSDFYYKYAFYRKALYINTDNNAIVNAFVSNEVSGKRVATLSDLINYNRDIILTVDDNFYNANRINEVIGRLDYTAIRQTEGADNGETNVFKSAGNWISGAMDLDPATILKTGDVTYYSSTLAGAVTKLGQEDEDKLPSVLDSYVLASDDIIGSTDVESVLDSYEYSIKMSYGVVSAIYRSPSLYNECLRGIVADNAIFKSSIAICNTPGTTSTHWRSVYNYCMLMNLEDQMKNTANTTLDLDAPIFVDIFGNIITESGTVIIPAACNATLCGTNWTPYTVGWSEYYNNGNRLDTKVFNKDVYEWLMGIKISDMSTAGVPTDFTDMQDAKGTNAGGFMTISHDTMILRTSDLQSGNLRGTVQWDALNKSSSVVKDLFFNDAYFTKGKKMFSHIITNMIIEVLRGAPIESIDFEYEGLDGNTKISKYGVYMAYKLEELVHSLVGGTNGGKAGNVVVTMPNLAFVSGIEYIMLYVFKIVFALMLVALGVSLYIDATKNTLGLKSVGKFIVTVISVIVTFTLIPNLISWTYYQANKTMLADEAGQLMMLNYVKEYDGAEIGITQVTTPETTTELYLKLDSAAVSWWKIIPDVLFGNSAQTVTQLYEDELKDSSMAHTPGVQLKGDGLYMSIQDVFDSTAVQFTPATNTLQQYILNNRTAIFLKSNTDGDGGGTVQTLGVDNTSAVSFTSPYYVFLEQLIANINEYNVSRDVTAYSWSVGSNGHVLTYDILTPYLSSAEFLEEGYDILGLDKTLGLTAPRTNYNYAFTDSDLRKIKYSLWYYDAHENENYARNKIDSLYEYARNFVINNKDIMGKVPDEVFLKVFAMQLACEYNRLFGIPASNSIEIINVDTRDLLRTMISSYGDMYKYYSYSFSRYVYEQTGSIGVVFAALLLVILWLTSFLKPAFMLAITALLIVNLVFRKVLFRKESKCVEGYLIGAGCLCLFNYAYALMLKVSMSLANAGLGSITALSAALLTQILYVVMLVGILVIEMKDWRNNGFGEFSTIGAAISSNIVHSKNIIVEKLVAKQNQAYRESERSRTYQSDNYDSSSVDAMIERDHEREERGTFNPD